MPKISINATDLTNVDVNFVAMVKRGANRIPFRLTKSEDAEMDLYSLGKTLFKKGDSPQIIGVFMAKSLDTPATLAMLKGAGINFEPLEKSEFRGIIQHTLKSGESFPDTVLVRFSPELAVNVRGMKKGAFEPGAHINSPSLAAAELQKTIGAITKSSETASYGVDVSKATADFNSYMAKLVENLPQEAMRLDGLLKIGTGNAKGGAGGNQETGDGLGDNSNGGKQTTMKNGGNDGADVDKALGLDPLIPGKDAGKGPEKAAKADAGLNGTGAGFELGGGTETNAHATADDAQNTSINAKPGGHVSGSNNPAFPGPGEGAHTISVTTKSATVLAAELAVAKAELALALVKDQSAARAASGKDGEPMDGDDDTSTIGSTEGLNPKLKAPMAQGGVNKVDGSGGKQTVDVTTQEVIGESASGEGAGESATDDSLAAQARATADDADNAGGKIAGKVKGPTLDMAGVPDKLKSPTTKNTGDQVTGLKGKTPEQVLEESQSGAGAQANMAQTFKTEQAAVMQAIAALSKSLKEGLAGVTKDVSALKEQVGKIDGTLQKHDAALSGTVFGEAGGDVVRTITKTENGGPALLDTAYHRNAA